jgi:hypothetical protein
MLRQGRTTTDREQMGMTGKKGAGGGAKTSRSETVSVRMDPRLRYLAEIAARVQRRTLSSFIEYAVDDALKRVFMPTDQTRVRGGVALDEPVPVADAAGTIWDFDDPGRLALLARRYPQLLTFEETRTWMLFLEVLKRTSGPHKELAGQASAETDLLRQHWDLLTTAAEAGTPVAEVAAEIQRKINAAAKKQGWSDKQPMPLAPAKGAK